MIRVDCPKCHGGDPTCATCHGTGKMHPARARQWEESRASRERGEGRPDVAQREHYGAARLDDDGARKRLRAAVDKAGSIRAYAGIVGLSASYVSDVLLGRRELGASLCKALCLVKVVERRVTYQPVK